MFAMLVLTFIAVAYHNCAPTGSSSGSSAATLPPGSNVIPVCPYTANAQPTISGVFVDAALSTPATNSSYRVGMGADAGDEAQKTFYVRADSGDTYSTIIDLNCDAGTSGLNANCDINNGNLRIRISSAQGSECLSGAATITVRVADAISAPGCQNLSRNSNNFSFNINRVNGCYPTVRSNPPTPYAAGQLGASVATDGIWAVASSPNDEQSGLVDSGAAYFYRYNGTAWSLFAKKIPSTILAASQLGAVAISGNTAVVGAGLHNNGTGKAWVYQFNGTDWIQISELAAPTPVLGELFGSTVAIANGIIAVAAPRNAVNGSQSGAVYLFSASNFSFLQALAPSIDSQIAGDVLAGGEFGTSMVFAGDTLAVGAPFANASVNRKEAVYIFKNNGGFILSQKIVNADGNANKYFGRSLAIDGNNLLIGAPFCNGNALTQVGRAYIYNRATSAALFGATFTTLNPADAGNNDHFGHSVALAGNSVLVGAPDKTFDQMAKVGAVYLFNLSGAQQFKIRSRLGDRDNDSFGVSIGVSNGWLISGAFNDEDPNSGVLNAGAIYFVDIP